MHPISPQSVVFAFIFLMVLTLVCATRPALAAGVPTPGQMAWHEMEIEMLLCLDPCTWQGREYDNHTTPQDQVNPTQLDTDQWCQAAQSFGARQIVFVAKHTGGFCWWQTETSNYGIRNTPYKGGKGDVLAELSQSCRKYGLKLGIYLYPGDEQWGAGIGSGGRTKNPARQEAYNAVLRQQWTEVLSRYGEISELWFDGSCVIELGDVIKQWAPSAMVFQGPHATLRWPGNEKGIAPYPAWQTVDKAAAATGVSTGKDSNPDGDVWLPMEMDTTLLDHKWFWGPDTDPMLKSVQTLMDVYYTSVGRGCVLMLNATPDTTGRIPESHIQRYREFGRAIESLYEKPKGEISGTGTTLELRFAGPTRVNRVVTMEDIRAGQRVRAYTLECFRNGTWKKCLTGQSIGYKKIDVLESADIDGLRLCITDASDTPQIKRFAAYEAPESTNPSASVTVPENHWKLVDTEKPIRATTTWIPIEIPLTARIQTPGEYEIELRTKDEKAAVKVKNAVILMGGTEAPRLIRSLGRGNAWRISRTDQVTPDEHGVTLLRLELRVRGGEETPVEFFVRPAENKPD